MQKPIHHRPSAAYLLLLLTAVIIIPSAQAQSQKASKNHYKPHLHYFLLIPFTGAGLQFNSRAGGLLGVSFPYSVTDASGNVSNSVFTSSPAKIYPPTRIDFGTLGFQLGRGKHFYDMALSFPLVAGSLTDGVRIRSGYGFNWFRQKSMLVQTSLNLVYTLDTGDNSGAQLGSIDNSGSTIHILGFESGPTYTVTRSQSRYGPSVTNTYQTTSLSLSYAQQEIDLLPAITLLNNPSWYKLHFMVSVGYSIPIIERGDIYLIQHGGDNPINRLGNRIANDPAITLTYNGNRTHAVPYRFGGPYLSLAFGVRRGRIQP
jgi:hypothetical protein